MYNLKQTDWTPKEPFHAIKVGGELHPCTYQSDSKKGKFNAFIQGKGWQSAKSAILVPLFTGTTKEEFESYLAQWGKYNLFYSITGFELGSSDCVVWSAIQEFHVLLNVGYDYILALYNRLIDINNVIEKKTMESLGLKLVDGVFKVPVTGKFIDLEDRLVYMDNLFVVRPHYSLMGYFLVSPHIDPISDDAKLLKHFAEVFEPKTDEDFEKFPVSVKDRLAFLFGQEVAELYEKTMRDFPLDYKPKKVKTKAAA